MQPIILYSHPLGPNPWKTAIVLEELGLPYENRYVDPLQVKQKPFTDLNPNGRVPCIEDPNQGMVLWESAAINLYLVQTYDKDERLWCEDGPDFFYMSQWLFFQMSGQGPYFGQAAWFTFRHSEHLPSAVKRYCQEIHRVIGVLDGVLVGKDYLVADRCTIADLAFIPWDCEVRNILEDHDFLDNLSRDYPNYYSWHKRLTSRPAVQKVLQTREQALAAAGPGIIPQKVADKSEHT